MENKLREGVIPNKIKMKLKIILYLIDLLNKDYNFSISFNNMFTNHFKLNTLKGSYEFSTYKDVINCLQLLIEIQIDNKVKNYDNEESEVNE